MRTLFYHKMWTQDDNTNTGTVLLLTRDCKIQNVFSYANHSLRDDGMKNINGRPLSRRSLHTYT